MTERQALLLIGSPKLKGSTSESVGDYLMARLEESGCDYTTCHAPRVLGGQADGKTLLDAVDAAGLVVLSTPLYVDCQPAPLIRAMELIAERRRRTPRESRPRFMAIVQCGFPEASQNDLALRIYRRFAKEADLQWVGGLGIGCGPMIQGKPLDTTGFPLRRLRRALELTAEALASGRDVPDEAVHLAAKPFTPAWIYVKLGNMMWNRVARKHGLTKEDLYARPYATR